MPTVFHHSEPDRRSDKAQRRIDLRGSASSSSEEAVAKRIVALYRDGKTPTEIVNITGRARHRVVHTLHQAGFHMGTRQAPPLPDAPEESSQDPVR